MLVKDDIAFYREPGYLVVPGVLDAEDVDRLGARDQRHATAGGEVDV